MVALSLARNHLCMFGKGHYEKHFCEIVLNLDQRFRRSHFNLIKVSLI